FLKREKQPLNTVYPGEDGFARCWQRAMQLADGSLDPADTFYPDTWQRAILPQRVVQRQYYFKASRICRGVALSRTQRAAAWPVFEEMRMQLHQAGLVTSEDAVYLVMDMLKEGAVVRPYRAAVVDEAQDFGVESLQLVRALVAEDADDLMIVGDGHQR